MALMNMGKLVFAQIMEHLPRTTFGRCVARYGGERKVKTFSCLDQYLCMAFAQLGARALPPRDEREHPASRSIASASGASLGNRAS